MGVFSPKQDRSRWQTKPAGDVRDKDELRFHGYVQWTMGYPHKQIAVHVCNYNVSPMQEYTLLIPQKSEVEWRRS